MKTRIAFLVTLFAAAALGAPPPDADVVVPVSGWPAEAVGPEVWSFPVLESIHLLDFMDEEGEGQSASGEAATMLAELFADELAEAGGDIEETAEGLRLSGPAAVVAGLRSRIEGISKFLEGRFSVSVALYGLAAGETAPSKTAGELLFTAVLSGRRGETVLRESLDRRNLVVAHDAELAIGASVAEPMTADLVTGTRVAVQCRALESGAADVVLSVHLSRAVEEIRRVRTAAGDLDLPEVPFLSFTAGMTAERGKSVTTTVPSPFGDGSIAAVVTLLEAPSATGTDLALIDLVAAAGHPDVADGYLAPGYQPPLDAEGPDAPREWGDRRSEAIGHSVDTLYGAEIETVRLNDTVLALVGPAADVARAREIIGGPRSRRFTRETARLEFAKLARAEWFDPITGAVTGSPPGLARDTGATVSKTPFVLLRGTWRRIVTTLDVEVAQSAAMVESKVFPHFEGESLLVLAGAAGSAVVRTAEGRIVSHETAMLEVRLDIDGKRSTDASNLVDILRTAFAETDLEFGPEPAVQILKVGAEAVVHRFSMD